VSAAFPVSEPEFEQQNLPQLILVGVETLGKPLQPFQKRVVFHESRLHHPYLSGFREEPGGQRHERLAKGLLIDGLGFAVDDGLRQERGKSPAHQTPRLVGAAHLAGGNGQHEFHQRTVSEGMRPGEVLQGFGRLQDTPFQGVVQHAEAAPPAGHGVPPLFAIRGFNPGGKQGAQTESQGIQVGESPPRSGERVGNHGSRPAKPGGAHGPPENRVDRDLDGLAPGQCLAHGRSPAALLHIVGGLVAIVLQVAHDEVAELAGEEHTRAESFHAACQLRHPGLPPAGSRAAGLGGGHQRDILQIEMDSLEVAGALHGSNVRLVAAARMQVAEGDGFRGRRQKPLAHANDRRRVQAAAQLRAHRRAARQAHLNRFAKQSPEPFLVIPLVGEAQLLVYGQAPEGLYRKGFRRDADRMAGRNLADAGIRRAVGCGPAHQESRGEFLVECSAPGPLDQAGQRGRPAETAVAAPVIQRPYAGVVAGQHHALRPGVPDRQAPVAD